MTFNPPGGATYLCISMQVWDISIAVVLFDVGLISLTQ